MKKEHGYFEAHWHQQVFFVELHGGWNLDTANHYLDELRSYGHSRKGARWAVLADLRHWGLATSDVFGPLSNASIEMDRIGRTHTGIIAENEDMKAAIVEAAIKHPPPQAEICIFATVNEGRNWLIGNGFEFDD